MEFSKIPVKNRFVIGFLLLFKMFCLPANGAQEICSLPTLFEPDRIAWRSLSYNAKTIFGNMTTDVYHSTFSTDEVFDFLIVVTDGAASQPSGATIFTFTVHSIINSLFGSDEILKTQSWIDSNAGAALQRIRQRRGKERWQKSYRYPDKGVFRLKKKPKD